MLVGIMTWTAKYLETFFIDHVDNLCHEAPPVIHDIFANTTIHAHVPCIDGVKTSLTWALMSAACVYAQF